MNPLDVALDTLKGHPSYDKRNLSDDAIRHKREYDTKYESTPERTKYRTDLKRERRQRGMMGHGGPDLSHTKRGGLVRENVHDNRARNQPGHSLKMLKFTGAGGREDESQQASWDTLQGLTAPDEEETETPTMGQEMRFPGVLVGDQWASTREEAKEMGAKFPPQDVMHRPQVEVMGRPESGEVRTETEASKAGGYEGVSYGDYPGMGEGYHRPIDPSYAGHHELSNDDFLSHAREFDNDGYAYMDKIGVPPHHQKAYGMRLHSYFANRMRRMDEANSMRKWLASKGMDLSDADDEEVRDTYWMEQQPDW